MIEGINAYYDPKTRTINNCKENTNAWFHESRHKWQHEHGWFDYEQYINLLIFVTAITRLWWFVLPIVIYTLIIEFDAVAYSVKMSLKQRIKDMAKMAIGGRL